MRAHDQSQAVLTLIFCFGEIVSIDSEAAIQIFKIPSVPVMWDSGCFVKISKEFRLNLIEQAPSMDLMIKSKQAKRESKSIEFKSKFDPSSTGEWCQIVKDLVALSNSGGGVIVIGLDSNGAPSQEDISAPISVDPASISDWVYRYTGVHYSGIELFGDMKDGWPILIIKIDASPVPMVFTKPGTYEIGGSKRQRQKTAFSQGTVYFRHGAKSEPGDSDDHRKVIEWNLKETRKAWLDGVKKVTAAPQGSILSVTERFLQEHTSSGAFPIRVVDDPNAPGFRAIGPDETHPHRQKDLIEQVNLKLPSGQSINSYDVQIAKKLFRIHEDRELCHIPKFSSPQWSDACIRWFLDHFSSDPQFFLNARETIRSLQNRD